MQYSLLQVALIMLDLTSYLLDRLYIDKAHQAVCAMFERRAISTRRTNKPFFTSPVNWNFEQIMCMLMFHPD